MNLQPPQSIADGAWRILLIDSDEDDFILIRDMLRGAKGRRIALSWAPAYEAGQTKLAEDLYDAVLVDNDLGARSGIDLIRSANERGATIPFILFNGRGSYEVDLEAMKAGATLYLSKNELSALSLERFIRYAIERKRDEISLKKSEEKFEKAFRSSPIAISISTLNDGRLIEVNDSYAAFSGFSQEELIGRTTVELGIYTDPRIREEAVQLFHEGRGIRNYEVQARTKSGEIRDVLFSAEPMMIHGQECGLSLVVDITERKRAEKALQESEEKFRTLFENSPEAVFLTTPDGAVQAANPAASAMFGWSEKEIIGLGRSGLLDTTDPRLAAALQERSQTGRFQAREYTAIRKGGERFPVEVDSVVLPGEPSTSFVILRDITERKQSEIKLRENEGRERNRAHELAAILDAVPAYIFITHDPDSRTMTANRATQELLRSKPGDNISKTAPEPEIPRQFRAMRNGIEIPNDELPVQLAAAKCVYVEDYEFDVVFEDGSSRRLMGNAAPLSDECGNHAGAVGAFIDITDLRRIEQETSERTAMMEVQRRLLEHREMERAQIARDLHDGPIQSLGGLGFSLQMLQSAVENPEARDMIDQMKQDVRDLAGELRAVCNELRPPLLERFGFRKAIQAHLDGFRERHPEIRLHLSMTENKDQLPEHTATALFRIYQEALNNIIRHSQASEISIHFAFDPQQILLEIQDNGNGFLVHSDWVELARQGHFGLIGMKERAEAIGGGFQVQSSAEEGTTIRVIVPIGE